MLIFDRNRAWKNSCNYLKIFTFEKFHAKMNDKIDVKIPRFEKIGLNAALETLETAESVKFCLKI